MGTEELVSLLNTQTVPGERPNELTASESPPLPGNACIPPETLTSIAGNDKIVED